MKNSLLLSVLFLVCGSTAFASPYPAGTSYTCKAESKELFGDFTLTVKSQLPYVEDLQEKTPNSEIDIYLSLDGKNRVVDAICFVNSEAEELVGCMGLEEEDNEAYAFFIIALHTGLLQAQLTQDQTGAGEFYGYTCKKN